MHQQVVWFFAGTIVMLIAVRLRRRLLPPSGERPHGDDEQSQIRHSASAASIAPANDELARARQAVVEYARSCRRGILAEHSAAVQRDQWQHLMRAVDALEQIESRKNPRTDDGGPATVSTLPVNRR